MAVQTTLITQKQLQEIHDLQSELSMKEERLENLTSGLRDLLFARVPIERGRFDARLVFKKMHAVAWKQIVIDQLGLDYAESVRKSTPTVTRCEVLIVEHAIPPLWKEHSTTPEQAQ